MNEFDVLNNPQQNNTSGNFGLDKLKKKSFPWGKLVILVVVIAAVAGYFMYRHELGFYFYAQTVKDQPNYEQLKEGLKSDYLKAVKDPNNAELVLNLGAKQFALKDFKSAVQNFERVLEIQPLNVVAFENIARTYQYMNDYKKAEEYGKKYLEKFPTQAEPYGILGDLYTNFYTEKYGELDKLYQTAYEKTLNPQFLLLRSGYYDKKGQYDKAVEMVKLWLADPKATSDNSRKLLVEGLLKEYEEKAKK